MKQLYRKDPSMLFGMFKIAKQTRMAKETHFTEKTRLFMGCMSQ